MKQKIKRIRTSLTSSGGGGRRAGGGKSCPNLERSTARLMWHWGQLKRDNPWGTLRIALQLAHGSWILVGSMPWAGAFLSCWAWTWAWAWVERINSGGSICGNWHVGHTNSVKPGSTVSTTLQPAQRTWHPAAGTAPTWADWGSGGGGEGAIGGVGNDGCPIWRCK